LLISPFRGDALGIYAAKGRKRFLALDHLAQAIDHLRMSLSGRDLQDEFRAANELFHSLDKEQQKTES
jgi:hypothetical protein